MSCKAQAAAKNLQKYEENLSFMDTSLTPSMTRENKYSVMLSMTKNKSVLHEDYSV